MIRYLAALCFALAPALQAQEERELSIPTDHVTRTGVTQATITSTIQQGYRLVDLEYRGTTLFGPSYDAVFVKNSGAYAKTWWWYVNASVAQISALLIQNSARLIDLEPYVDGSGSLRYACIMVDNTGANAKSWWWYVNQSTSALSTKVSQNNARLVDVDTYTFGGNTYHSGIMIRNTGSDARSWWWYVNQTIGQISSLINSNNAQLYDLERLPNGRFNCIMLRNPNPAQWYWWSGLTSADIAYNMGQYGARVIDVESYVQGGVRRYAALMINNSNTLSTSVGNAMRSRTNGQVGCWLERTNGGNLAYLNGDTVFEPASSMKVLHHVHAMRRVRFGLPLTTPLTVYASYNGSCPLDLIPFTEQLQPALQAMMEQSDNARTQAIRSYFGDANLNSTASLLGMSSTSSNHRLGCNGDAVANPNRITLRDLGRLHTQVANGYLGSRRELFYQLMLDNVNDLGIANLIHAEGASLGLSAATIASFRSFTRVAHKGGSYGLNNGGALWFERCEFGYLSLPFVTNDVITPREYTFGAFVNDASNDSQASAAIYTDAIPRLLRPQIRAALQSWSSSLASVASYGSGCGSFHQTATGLPRLGQTVTYRGYSGFANSIVLFGLGFSNTAWNGVPLPAALAPVGGGSGCFALTDIQISDAGVTDSFGRANFSVDIPSSTDGIGFRYYTQLYSFDATTFLTTNGQRSIVGL